MRWPPRDAAGAVPPVMAAPDTDSAAGMDDANVKFLVAPLRSETSATMPSVGLFPVAVMRDPSAVLMVLARDVAVAALLVAAVQCVPCMSFVPLTVSTALSRPPEKNGVATDRIDGTGDTNGVAL